MSSYKKRVQTINKKGARQKGYYQNPEIEKIKKIAAITERAEKMRTPIVPPQTKFYKI